MPELPIIESRLAVFSPISLTEMKEVRLMDRIDTKYVTSADDIIPLLDALKGDFMVQEVGGRRVARYETTYYDTEDSDMFRSHQRGKLNRLKIRMRSYLDTDDTFLEIKNKNNKARTKKRRVRCDDRSPKSLMANSEFIMNASGIGPETISANIENSFNRITLVNKARTERLTIDFGLAFHNARNGRSETMDGITIIELKQEERSVSMARETLRELRIKATGFSKYCVGCGITGTDARMNRLKPKLRYIEKLTDRAI